MVVEAAEEAATATASLTLTVRCLFQQRHREGTLPLQLISLCADVILQADVVLRANPGWRSLPHVQKAQTMVSVLKHLLIFKILLHDK